MIINNSLWAGSVTLLLTVILFTPIAFTENISLSNCLLVPDDSDKNTIHLMLAALQTQKSDVLSVSGSETLKQENYSQTIKTRSLNYIDLDYLKKIENKIIQGKLYACYQRN